MKRPNCPIWITPATFFVKINQFYFWIFRLNDLGYHDDGPTPSNPLFYSHFFVLFLFRFSLLGKSMSEMAKKGIFFIYEMKFPREFFQLQ